MNDYLQYLLALEAAREHTREAEERARLRWGMEPEPALGQGIAVRLASLGRFVLGRAKPSRETPSSRLSGAITHQPGDRAVA